MYKVILILDWFFLKYEEWLKLTLWPPPPPNPDPLLKKLFSKSPDLLVLKKLETSLSLISNRIQVSSKLLKSVLVMNKKNFFYHWCKFFFIDLFSIKTSSNWFVASARTFLQQFKVTDVIKTSLHTSPLMLEYTLHRS